MTTANPNMDHLWGENLDLILSFLEGEDWKEFRLVCQSWNDRVLAKFCKKLEFRVAIGGRKDKTFPTVTDTRVLSSVLLEIVPNKSTSFVIMLTSSLDIFRNAGCPEGLRALEVDMHMDERDFECLIRAINDGRLPGLERLSLFVKFSQREEEYKCASRVFPNSLPKLRSLNIIPIYNIEYDDVDDEDEDLDDEYRRRREKHLNIIAAIQSVADAAAADFYYLSSHIYLDLSGRRVNDLTLFDNGHLKETEAIAMLNSVAESLTSLTLYNVYPHFRGSTFPKLRTIFSEDWGESDKKISVSSLPALTEIRLPIQAINWDEFTALTVTLPKLRHVDIAEIPHLTPPDWEDLIQPFRTLLNAEVDSLFLRFQRGFSTPTPSLLSFFEMLDLNTNLRKQKSGDLTFKFLWDGEEYEDEEKDEAEIEVDCVSILIKLRDHWETVQLS